MSIFRDGHLVTDSPTARLETAEWYIRSAGAEPADFVDTVGDVRVELATGGGGIKCPATSIGGTCSVKAMCTYVYLSTC